MSHAIIYRGCGVQRPVVLTVPVIVKETSSPFLNADFTGRAMTVPAPALAIVIIAKRHRIIFRTFIDHSTLIRKDSDLTIP